MIRSILAFPATLLLLAPAIVEGGPAIPGREDQTSLVESLRQTEIAFSASVEKGDAERFADFIAEEAVFLGNSVLRGKDEILAAWQIFFEKGGPRLTWHPEIVEIGEESELGMTRGPYTLTAHSADGKTSTETGVFTSIWKRQSDGSWQVLFDAGCPPCAESAPSAD